jgi:hypothetical protein
LLDPSWGLNGAVTFAPFHAPVFSHSTLFMRKCGKPLERRTGSGSATVHSSIFGSLTSDPIALSYPGVSRKCLRGSQMCRGVGWEAISAAWPWGVLNGLQETYTFLLSCSVLKELTGDFRVP